ncbi:MAG: HAMP domain-containing protein, partial [Rivularia sp. ALOHA_DT_140]|nr:HAMP domain-containing protein [Rivularia sp. ALOHA_DT_140]
MVTDKSGKQETSKNNQNVFQRLVRARSGISLKTALIVPFVLQIFGTVGLVSYLSLKNSQEAVTKVVSELRGEISDRIKLHLHDYLEYPHLINRNNEQAIRVGTLNLNQPNTIARKFWQQKQIFKDVNVIYLGNEKGGYLGVDTTNKITISKNYQAGQLLTYNTEDRGRPFGIPELGQPDYDARVRPWYKKTRNRKRFQWSDIYTYNDGSNIAIAATRPFYNNGKFAGVLAADISLKQITNFLQKMRVGKTGQVFIVERDGVVVASSTDEETYYKKGNKIERLIAANSNSALMRESIQFLKQRFGSLKNIKKTQQLEFDIEGKGQFLQVTTFQDEYGLDWLIVIVIPEADFMSQINESQRNTILLSLLALIIVIVISVITARRISQPVSRLKQAVRNITEGKWEGTETVKGSRIYEVGELAHSFNNMAHQLHESFESLENKNQELERLDKLKD